MESYLFDQIKKKNLQEYLHLTSSKTKKSMIIYAIDDENAFISRSRITESLLTHIAENEAKFAHQRILIIARTDKARKIGIQHFGQG